MVMVLSSDLWLKFLKKLKMSKLINPLFKDFSISSTELKKTSSLLPLLKEMLTEPDKKISKNFLKN